MFKVAKYCATIIVFVYSAITIADYFLTSSDRYVRPNAVQLVGKGSCSGEQIIAPSGRKYILTAGHCRDLNDGKPSITVKTEDGRTLERAIIAEDPNSDLLLLEGVPGVEGLSIAESYSPQQHVRTFTHGGGLPLYKTEGVLIGQKFINIPLYEINISQCGQQKNIIGKTEDGGDLCGLHVKEMVTTALVVPGSSGGIVVDDSGDLIGVVSATTGEFGLIVTIQDIKAFTRNY